MSGLRMWARFGAFEPIFEGPGTVSTVQVQGKGKWAGASPQKNGGRANVLLAGMLGMAS